MQQWGSHGVESKTHPGCHPSEASKTQTGPRVLPAAQQLTPSFKNSKDCEGEPGWAPGPRRGDPQHRAAAKTRRQL